jgi:hypothetical protein
LRFDAVHRLLRAASRAGVEGLSTIEVDGRTASVAIMVTDYHDTPAVGLSRNDGVHGPSLCAVKDMPEHVCLLKVPWACLVSGSSWAEDSSMGRALAAEGVLHTSALLGSSSSDGSSNSEAAAALVTEGTEFQGSEPLLVLWLLLQNRWAPGDDHDYCGDHDSNGHHNSGVVDGASSSRASLERAARRAYFEALDIEAVPGGVESRCAFAWHETDIARFLAPSPAATRALACRAEMQAAFSTLQALLAKSAVWQDNLAAAVSADQTAGCSSRRGADVTWGEFVWAYATVASRAVRFTTSRSDRSTWSGLYLEMVGDLLNHAPPRRLLQQARIKEGGSVTAMQEAAPALVVACVFRFLNEGDGCIQYHAEDGGVSRRSQRTNL